MEYFLFNVVIAFKYYKNTNTEILIKVLYLNKYKGLWGKGNQKVS